MFLFSAVLYYEAFYYMYLGRFLGYNIYNIACYDIV